MVAGGRRWQQGSGFIVRLGAKGPTKSSVVLSVINAHGSVTGENEATRFAKNV